MLIRMRTTLILDDNLFQAAKRRAAERKSTLSDVVNDALRQLISRPAATKRRIKLPTFGDPRKKRRITPQQIAEALLEHV